MMNIKSIIPLTVKQLYRKIRGYCLLKWLKFRRRELNYLYNESFSTHPLRDKDWKEQFYEIIMKNFAPKSVVDFGCGTGDLLQPFEQAMIDVLGIDGSDHNFTNRKIDEKNFKVADLREKFSLSKKYDLCLCLEVAEHVEEKYSAALVDNLMSSSDRIIFTAAVPGQEGHDHCNLKPHSWWISRFEEKGFNYDEKSTESMREDLKATPGVQKWYINNLMIFTGGG